MMSARKFARIIRVNVDPDDVDAFKAIMIVLDNAPSDSWMSSKELFALRISKHACITGSQVGRLHMHEFLYNLTKLRMLERVRADETEAWVYRRLRGDFDIDAAWLKLRNAFGINAAPRTALKITRTRPAHWCVRGSRKHRHTTANPIEPPIAKRLIAWLFNEDENDSSRWVRACTAYAEWFEDERRMLDPRDFLERRSA